MILVRTTEIQVEHESTEQRLPLHQQKQPQPQPQPQQPLEAEYSSDDDIASPELDLNDHDQSDKKQGGFAMDDDELLSEEDEEEQDEEEASSEGQDYDTESSVDDSDLLKRLEEKYGKLPQRSNANEDDDDDDNGEWTST